MKKIAMLSWVTLACVLTACTAEFPGPGPGTPVPPQPANPGMDASESAPDANPSAHYAIASNRVSGAPIGGDITRAMDSIDKQKLSRALDNPIGKASHWVNALTDVSYTVVPVAKVSMPGNPYCRRYNTTAVRGEKTQQSSGVACVDSNGTWQSVAG